MSSPPLAEPAVRVAVGYDEGLDAPVELGREHVVALGDVAGDHAGAVAAILAAEKLYDTDYSPKAKPVAAVTARVRLAAGDVPGAERWAADAGVSADDDPTYLREYEHLTLAHVLLASRHAADAIKMLDRVRAAAEAGGRNGNAIEALLLLALAHDQMGSHTGGLPLSSRRSPAPGPSGSSACSSRPVPRPRTS